MKTMKYINKVLKVMFACLLSGIGQAMGQTAHTLNTNGETISGDKIVTLNSDIQLNGTIIIPSNAKLTIKGKGTITTYTSDNDVISFDVKGTGQLVIEGDNNQDDRIIFDGGNTGLAGNTNVNSPETPYKNVTAPVGFTKAGIVIKVRDRGQLTLKNVLACNLYSISNAGSFVDVVDADDDIDTSTSSRSVVDMTHVEIKNCMSIGGSGVVLANGQLLHNTINMTDCTIQYCTTLNSYGGIIKGSGKTDCNLNMTNCSMKYCWGSGWGGAILWASNLDDCKAYLKSCTFENNYVRYLGGAISTEATLELENCKISNNTAGAGGGGIAAFPFTLEDINASGTAVGLKLLTGNKISGNKTLKVEASFDPSLTIKGAINQLPTGGGGIWVLMNKEDWTCEINVTSFNEISGNTSAYHGGGIFLYKTTDVEDDTKMSINATISKNSAQSGGGIAVGSSTTFFPSVTLYGGQVSGNTASNGNGGGIYMPGGVFTIEGGSITENKALVAQGSTSSSERGNGGGIAITEGEFNVKTTAFTVSNNEAKRYGGGLYVYKSTNDVEFHGGTFTNNTALAGGGVSLEGTSSDKRVALVMNANVESNTATNGGGIYLNNYADMTFTGGLLRNNTAGDKNTAKLSEKTAYKKTVSQVAGVGGGVFLDNNTTLEFKVDNELGLYGNRASNAADDIFANGNGTSVTLPNVDAMTLTGFSVPASTLFWAEDYYSNYENGTYEHDASYSNGTNLLTNVSDPDGNLRYQYAFQQLKRPHIVKITNVSGFNENHKGKYICLTLGYYVYYVTIKKKGLEDGESAIFTISTNKSNVPNPYITMLLSNVQGATKEGDWIIRKVALPEGTWTVTEQKGWSWSYSIVGASSLTKKINGDDVSFEFENTKEKTEILYDEGIKINRMGN